MGWRSAAGFVGRWSSAGASPRVARRARPVRSSTLVHPRLARVGAGRFVRCSGVVPVLSAGDPGFWVPLHSKRGAGRFVRCLGRRPRSGRRSCSPTTSMSGRTVAPSFWPTNVFQRTPMSGRTVPPPDPTEDGPPPTAGATRREPTRRIGQPCPRPPGVDEGRRTTRANASEEVERRARPRPERRGLTAERQQPRRDVSQLDESENRAPASQGWTRADERTGRTRARRSSDAPAPDQSDGGSPPSASNGAGGQGVDRGAPASPSVERPGVSAGGSRSSRGDRDDRGDSPGRSGCRGRGGCRAHLRSRCPRR